MFGGVQIFKMLDDTWWGGENALFKVAAKQWLGLLMNLDDVWWCLMTLDDAFWCFMTLDDGWWRLMTLNDAWFKMLLN